MLFGGTRQALRAVLIDRERGDCGASAWLSRMRLPLRIEGLPGRGGDGRFEEMPPQRCGALAQGRPSRLVESRERTNAEAIGFQDLFETAEAVMLEMGEEPPVHAAIGARTAGTHADEFAFFLVEFEP